MKILKVEHRILNLDMAPKNPSEEVPVVKIVKRTKIISEPKISEMTFNFLSALSDWAGSGFQTVSEEIFKERLATCRQCPLWDEKARFGAGKCNHSKCGCTKLKHWLKSSSCPDKKWIN